jgi:hypothetical protein
MQLASFSRRDSKKPELTSVFVHVGMSDKQHKVFTI